MAKKRRRIPRYLRGMKPAPPAREPQPGERDAQNRIIADTAKQAPHNSYTGRLHYADLPFTCVDCGVEQVWTAEQQQWWYEVAKGSIYSGAIHCRACRQQRRGKSSSPSA